MTLRRGLAPGIVMCMYMPNRQVHTQRLFGYASPRPLCPSRDGGTSRVNLVIMTADLQLCECTAMMVWDMHFYSLVIYSLELYGLWDIYQLRWQVCKQCSCTLSKRDKNNLLYPMTCPATT